MQKRKRKLGVTGLIGLTTLGVMLGGLTSGTITVCGRNVPGVTISDTDWEKKSPNNKLKRSLEDFQPPITYEMTQEQLAEQSCYDELDLLARCVAAESMNQGITGMRYVCRVILNRVESEEFPNTITDVIYQKNQFEVVQNGTIDSIDPLPEVFEACKLEMAECSDPNIVFFQAGGFSKYGRNAFRYKDHYFSYL